MGKQTLIQMPPGVDNFFDVIDFLKNKSAYENAMTEMKDLVTKANAAVAAKGKVQEIDNLHSTAKAMNAQAAAELQDAQAKRNKIIDSAKAEIDGQKQQIQSFNQRIVDREREVQERAEALDRRERALDAVQNKCVEEKKRSQQLQVSAQEMMAEATALKEAYDTRLADLRAKFESVS